ncbi:MAG: pilus assembly protein TadG-related protein, partial [Bryobacterales bacterium]
MKAYQSKCRGQVMIFIVLGIGLLFSLAGLAVDMIFTYAVKVRLVTAVDSTALGVARALGRGVTQ